LFVTPGLVIALRIAFYATSFPTVRGRFFTAIPDDCTEFVHWS